MVRRTKAEAEATRATILDAAERQFFEQGVSRTTLDKIARAAGVTRGAVYWHFDNKSDLFSAMLERIRLPFRMMLSEMDEVAGADSLQSVRDIMIRSLQIVGESEQHRRVLSIVFHRCEYIDELNPAVHEQEKLDMEVQQTLERAFERARQSGQLNPDVSPGLAASALHAYISGLIGKFLLTPNQCDLSQSAPALIDCFLDGVKKCQST
ncbi:TetR family transcriptional regulator [Lacimicrobium alkaliphilum]|uniref:TetR family transcriptional regulator n=1 Tax=Lacimicrobium alkaliphilum TaxID=1526571 RepID=A0A0U2ZML3_9ALTE|nr:TetR family transcriptional regulator [Lacimicrobium alkaliphilum]ALT00232.1 TetR family transcriptional regulator [Lacimicrobium alkaliphilum]